MYYETCIRFLNPMWNILFSNFKRRIATCSSFWCCRRAVLDGQRLFNRLGEELLVLAGGEDACDTKDVTGRALDASRRARLAADLELWFERYRVQWLSIGRYAELARIAHVVWSFADILRRGAL